MTAVCVETPVLEARDWSDADTTHLVQWFTDDPSLWQYVPGLDRPLTAEEVRAHAAQRLAQQETGHALVLAVDRDGQLACQFVIAPLVGTEGACHVLVARWAKGHGLALLKTAIREAQRRGLRKIVAIPSPLLPQDAYLRFLRRLGFTIKFYGEITT